MSNRIVLITGGTRGIGRAIAKRFENHGNDTVLACGRTEPPPGFPYRFIVCDVTDPGSVATLFGRIADEFRRLDVLVNNAGLAGSNPLDPGSDDTLWRSITSTNLDGTYYCCKAALPLLPDGTGRIVNIASVLGLRGVADQTAYCAAKHGVVGLTKALAHHLGPRGITVNAICPGWVETEMARQRFDALRLTAEAAAAQLPIGRTIQPEEVAGLVYFLASAEAAGITGTASTIDGGGLA